MTPGWTPGQVVLILVVTVSGLLTAYPLAVVGVLLQCSFWDSAEPAFGTRMMGLGSIVLAGVFAASGPLLAGAIRRSLVAYIVAGVIAGLALTAAAGLGVVVL